MRESPRELAPHGELHSERDRAHRDVERSTNTLLDQASGPFGEKCSGRRARRGFGSHEVENHFHLRSVLSSRGPKRAHKRRGIGGKRALHTHPGALDPKASVSVTRPSRSTSRHHEAAWPARARPPGSSVDWRRGAPLGPFGRDHATCLALGAAKKTAAEPRRQALHHPREPQEPRRRNRRARSPHVRL